MEHLFGTLPLGLRAFCSATVQSHKQQTTHCSIQGCLSKSSPACFYCSQGGGGLILTTKAGDLARRLGLAPSLGEIEELKAVAGEYCDMSTFATFCKEVAHSNDSPKLLAELFGCYDPSCTGKVPLRVVRNILQNCGEVLTNDEVDAILEESTDEVDYGAFCERLLSER